MNGGLSDRNYPCYLSEHPLRPCVYLHGVVQTSLDIPSKFSCWYLVWDVFHTVMVLWICLLFCWSTIKYQDPSGLVRPVNDNATIQYLSGFQPILPTPRSSRGWLPTSRILTLVELPQRPCLPNHVGTLDVLSKVCDHRDCQLYKGLGAIFTGYCRPYITELVRDFCYLFVVRTFSLTGKYRWLSIVSWCWCKTACRYTVVVALWEWPTPCRISAYHDELFVNIWTGP